MWFNKENLNLMLKKYKSILFLKNNVFLNFDQNFFKNTSLSTTIFSKDVSKKLKDLNNYYIFKVKKKKKSEFNYRFYLKNFLFFNNLVLFKLNLNFLFKFIYKKKKEKIKLLTMLSNVELKKKFLVKVNEFFFFKLLFYLKYNFFIDLLLFFFLKLKYLFEFYKVFDLNFLLFFKLNLLKSFKIKDLKNLWVYLDITFKNSSVFFFTELRWIKNNEIFSDFNFISSLNLDLLFNYWHNNIFDLKLKDHYILKVLFDKYKYFINNKIYILQLNKYLFIKSNYIKNKFYLNNNKIDINKNKLLFISFLKKNKTKLIKKKINKKNNVFFNDLNILNFIFYLYIFYILRHIYIIDLNYLNKIEFLYFFNPWSKIKLKIFKYILIIFLKLRNFFKIKFKRKFLKLVYSLHFFFLKKYSNLNFNLLNSIKSNYFFFTWNVIFKNIFLKTYIYYLENNILSIYNYKYNLINKKIYMFYLKNWKLSYISLVAILKTKEYKLLNFLKDLKFHIIVNLNIFKKLFELYKLGSYKFWSLFYLKKIIKLKIKFINLFISVIEKKIKKKSKKIIFLNGYNFKFFNFLFFNKKKRKLKNLKSFNILKLYTIFKFLFYKKILKTKFKINSNYSYNISFYLLKNLNSSLFIHLFFLVKLLMSEFLKNKFSFVYKYISIKSGFLKNYILYFYFFNNISLKLKYNKQLIFFKRKNFFGLDLIFNKKMKFNKNVYNNVFSNSSNLNVNFASFSLQFFFIKDIIYIFNMFFSFQSYDLELNNDLLLFNDILCSTDIYKIKIDNIWLIKKQQINIKIKKFFYFKIHFWNYIKSFSLNNNISLTQNYIKLNNKILNFYDYINDVGIMRSINVNNFFIDNNEKTLRRKFDNLQLNLVLTYIFLFFDDIIIFIDNSLYFLIDFIDNKYFNNYFSDDSLKVMSDSTLFFYKFLTKETMKFFMFSELNSVQINDLFLNLNFFFNILNYYLFIYFFKVTNYLFQLQRSVVFLNRKFKILNLKILNFNKAFSYLNYNIFIKKKFKLNLLQLNNLSKFNFSKNMKGYFVCQTCHLMKINKKTYIKLKYHYNTLNLKLQNLNKFVFKYCKYCDFYVVNIFENNVKYYKNFKYFIVDFLHLKKKDSFFIFDNKLFYVKLLNNNKIIFNNIVVFKYNRFIFPLYFFFDKRSLIYDLLINPNSWTNVAYETLISDSICFINKNKFLFLKSNELSLELLSNKNKLIKSLYNNWLFKRKNLKILTKNEKIKIKIKKQKLEFKRFSVN